MKEWVYIRVITGCPTATEQRYNGMEALNIRDFRSNLANSFNRAEQGENVLIRRKNEIYALIRIGREDLMISPELQKSINDARMALSNGETEGASSHEALDNLLSSL